MNQDTTNVWFGAQHADTRAALTEALPKLREMFSASGLALGQAGVSHEMPRQDTRRGEFAAAARPSGETEVASAAPAAPARAHPFLHCWTPGPDGFPAHPCACCATSQSNNPEKLYLIN